MLKSFSTTGIGSLPHSNPIEACRVVFEHVDIPFWPQLPRLSFFELMIPQYTEGFPFIRIEGEHIYVEKGRNKAESLFYEAIEDNSGFPISERYASGFYTFLDTLREKRQKLNIVKGQVTGPITFTLSLTDTQKRPIYFDEEMRELALYLLKGKVKWQVEKLKPYAEEVIIFIDEPILSALGTSTYIGVDRAEALRLLTEIVSYIKKLGSIAGIHCCSKADWSLVISSGIDILSLDAYIYWDTLSIYPEEIKEFINNGKFIAWGVVPTTDAIKKVGLEELKKQLERGLLSLERIGVPPDRIRRQILLTPSCGTGSMEIGSAMRVYSLLKDLSATYKRE